MIDCNTAHDISQIAEHAYNTGFGVGLLYGFGLVALGMLFWTYA